MKSDISPLIEAQDDNHHVLGYQINQKEWVRLPSVDALAQWESGVFVLEDPEGSHPPQELVDLMRHPKSSPRIY